MSTKIRTIEFLRTRFSNEASNFDDTILFFHEMRLMSIHGASIMLESNIEELLKMLDQSNDKEPLVTEFFIGKLLQGNSPLCIEARGFLDEFHFQANSWSFQPSNAQRLRFSGIRNLLIDFGTLEVDSTTGRYTISDERFVNGSLNVARVKLTRRDFLRINEERELLGRAAEQAIIAFERERLRLSTIPVTAIEHTADNDVNAGFDIKSFEAELDADGKPIPRYIEVKAVSALDYRFHWSRNEIDTASKHSGKYFLYLLPVKSSKEFYLDLLKTISDPANHIFHNKDWVCWEDSFSLSLATSQANAS